LPVFGAWLGIVLAGCAPSKPSETVIRIGEPAQTAPVADLSPGCPEGTHAEPDKGCVKDTEPLAVAADRPVEVDLEDGEPRTAGAYGPRKAHPATSLEVLRDRRIRRPPRSRALLMVEAQQLESLFMATPKASPDRPKLIRRLAEEYAEIAAAAAREKADHIVVGARKAAISYYAMLHSEYPKHCLSYHSQDPAKSTGCGDETVYFMAYDYEQLGQLDMARKAYLMLIQNWPISKYIPFAYLAFGELFFTEAHQDPSKWMFAEQSYREVLKYPPPENEVFGYALLRLGEAYQKQGDSRKAQAMYAKLRQAAVQYPIGDFMSLPASLIPTGSP
jgi:TolA-binding protein